MLHKLEYTAEYASAMKHVFGKTLIARNMEVATQFARTQNLDCITLEGKEPDGWKILGTREIWVLAGNTVIQKIMILAGNLDLSNLGAQEVKHFFQLF